MVAYHNSFAYFAWRFRLDFVGFVEPACVPPSPSYIASLIGTMRAGRPDHRAPAARTAEERRFLAQRTAPRGGAGGTVGAVPGADDYISLFDANVAASSAPAAR